MRHVSVAPFSKKKAPRSCRLIALGASDEWAGLACCMPNLDEPEKTGGCEGTVPLQQAGRQGAVSERRI